MSKQTKVYNYNQEKVRSTLLDSFRQKKWEATSADLIAVTGLPKVQVDNELVAIADEYGPRMQVTDSGEILYSFPRGAKSRYHGFIPSMKRFARGLRKGAAAFFSMLFKVWIMVMLIGYFVLFIALALVALLASMAGNRDRDSRGSGGGGFLVGGLFDAMIRIWFYSELFKGPEERRLQALDRAGKPKKKPLHRAIFSFVLGDGDKEAEWQSAMRKTFIAFVQSHRGCISMPEFIALTGQSPPDAEAQLNRFMYEFQGSPEVSDAGTIYFFFPELLRQKARASWNPEWAQVALKPVVPFSANTKKANTAFCVVNAINLLFGSYFFFSALATPATVFLVATPGQNPGFYGMVSKLAYQYLGMGDPTALIAIGLGFIPLVFSILFYITPAVRSLWLSSKNEIAKEQHLRAHAMQNINEVPLGIELKSIETAPSPKTRHIAKELAGWAQADVRPDGSYDFKEILRIRADMTKVRAGIDMKQYELGQTSFDTE